MNEEKLKQILKKIGRTDVPPNAAMIAERASRNFSAVLKIPQPKQSFFSPLRLIAAAAVIVLAFTAGRLSKITGPSAPFDTSNPVSDASWGNTALTYIHR